jgi:hypothetical protein
MLLGIWTRAALSSELQEYGHRVWRLVEAQHVVSTRKLVDTLDEQAILEDLIEASKPAVPPECRGLDYLLAAPFRYAPYPNGSRFRRPGLTPGVFYAAEESSAAVAEMAFYRLLFFAESPNTLWPTNPSEHTGFAVAVYSPRALDLTKPPLSVDEDAWRDPVDYGPCQTLAETAREAGAEILRYASARAPGGVCVAVMTCRAFAENAPAARETWRIGVSQSGAYALREFPRARIEFSREYFAADPRIAAMRWER